MVVFLELFRHIVSDLTYRVQRSVSNFRVWMGAVLAQDWNHHGDLLRVVDVFTNLTEGHDTSVFVAPVCVVLDSVNY